MPEARVVFFRDADGNCPLLQWLDQLRERDKKAIAKCRVLIALLRSRGNDLRRPHADFLRDGVCELRARHGKVQYRLLYFFHERTAVLTHGFVKRGAQVPGKEIDRAVSCRTQFLKDTKRHTHEEG